MSAFSKKNRASWYLLCAVAVAIVVTLSVPVLRAHVVMRISSIRQYASSSLDNAGLNLDLPTGNGWFNDMLFYHAENAINDDAGSPLDLSIFYTFGGYKEGRSSVYTPGSGYYTSFYGAYALQGNPAPDPTPALLKRIAAVDYETLILKDLGHPAPHGTFNVTASKTSPAGSYLGHSDWTRYDLLLKVPGAAHEKGKWLRHYWQFGTPPPLKGQPFEPTDLAGRLYAKTFPEQQLTLIIYLICESETILEQTDQRIQSLGSLSFNKRP
jgi:hypothetical protein